MTQANVKTIFYLVVIAIPLLVIIGGWFFISKGPSNRIGCGYEMAEKPVIIHIAGSTGGLRVFL